MSGYCSRPVILFARISPEATSHDFPRSDMSDVNPDIERLQRQLRTRISELIAAERHIATLEEKLFALKETKRQLKQLQEEKQALRKSPERKIGQVLLAPYRLPQKFVRHIRNRPSESEPTHHGAPTEYQQWFERHRLNEAQLPALRDEARRFAAQPLISIITPVFNTRAAWLEATIASVQEQAYEKWELILIDDGSTDEATLRVLPAVNTSDSRVRVVRLAKNSGISAASNAGLAAATGDWVALLDHDDLLEPDALFQIAKLLQTTPEADLIYTDEDKLTSEGLASPLFKPDWSPDFFLSYNYIQHFTAIRRALVSELGGFRSEYDFAQDYDLFLRVVSRTDRIYHIPRVLYHWRRAEGSTSINIRAKPATLDAARRALAAHMERVNESGHVAVDWRTHAFQIRRDLTEEKRIAIIITADQGTESCVRAIETKTDYSNYEVVVVENDSSGKEEARRYRRLRSAGFRNRSALRNLAVAATDAPWLLFLDSAIEPIASDWLTIMAEHVQRPEVGAVGARLLRRDGTIEHAGIVLGGSHLAQLAFRGFPAEDPGVSRQLQITRNCSAVSGACLLTRRDVFAQCGGFDEERLPDVWSDIDLCLKMRAAGYLIVFTPFAKLYYDADGALCASDSTTAVLRERWPQCLASDPYYNPNLSRERADFSLGK
jgi:glycosyltransferase involved in cell wall biosynthesis